MKVLLCETDSGMLEVIAVLLESRGFTVTAISDPTQLPPVDGFDALVTNCPHILNTGIHAVYISASQHLVDGVAARGIPAIFKQTDDFIAKLIGLLNQH